MAREVVWQGLRDGLSIGGDHRRQERTCVFPSWTCQQWGMFPSRQRAYDYRSHRPGDVRSVPGSSAGVAEHALLEVGWDQDDGDQLIEGADGNAVRFEVRGTCLTSRPSGRGVMRQTGETNVSLELLASNVTLPSHSRAQNSGRGSGAVWIIQATRRRRHHQVEIA